MLRLRLGIEDLARTTFAAPTPYCELAVSAQALQQTGWLTRAARRVCDDDRLRGFSSEAVIRCARFLVR